MENLSTEFWVVFQLLVDLAIVIMIILFFRRGEKENQNVAQNAPEEITISPEVTQAAVDRIVNLLEPLMHEADNAAVTFEGQIKEKYRLIKKLNEQLDTRIISLNLLLNRAESQLDANVGGAPERHHQTSDHQQGIFELYEQGLDSDHIAQKLSMPKGEVDLVIELKKKFLAMEKGV